MTPHPKVRISLQPLGETFEVPKGAPLRDVLFEHGVEFPCGGRGKCKACRIKVLKGNIPVTAELQSLLSPEEIQDGWRLSCRHKAEEDLTLELAQWEASILGNESRFEFTPREGFGVAIDLGTTTLVAQLLDLQTGNVLAVESALNSQARHGSDIMSRIDFAVAQNGRSSLEKLIRSQLGRMISHLLPTAQHHRQAIRDIVIVGNTVMHHFFCGIDPEPLAHFPFEPKSDGLQHFKTADLGWTSVGNANVWFLPCLGGFVGSDILAGILATGLHKKNELTGLIDLGTNGEMVIGNRERLLCASTAAGPAFEGAKISMGMRAATGAISEVAVEQAAMRCRVIGNRIPRGICGSGLVDAVAAGLQLEKIQANGRLAGGLDKLPLRQPVALNQADIRELQLAKGAIAAGLRILLQQWGARMEDMDCLHLAGAFGNYINRQSAQRIGLLPLPPGKVIPAGNTALLGAKQALFTPRGQDADYQQIRQKTTHVSLHADPRFQDIYVEEMLFPEQNQAPRHFAE
ncbi:MAG: ASKHA domain-containing protein [Verrucomicrobiae bacterium]|nr:ASKHA domain-containing protein [Verrucomicrobiae bacterium]